MYISKQNYPFCKSKIVVETYEYLTWCISQSKFTEVPKVLNSYYKYIAIYMYQYSYRKCTALALKRDYPQKKKKNSSNVGIYSSQLHLILFNFLWSSKYKSLFYIFIDMCFEELLIDRQTPSLTKSKIAIKKFAFQ